MHKRDFRSDNTAAPSREILDALMAAAANANDPYAADALTARVRERLGAIFEREVEIFPLVTGTAANALTLSMVTRSFGRILCHAESHIMTDECGAVEFISNGGRLEPVAGANCKLTPQALRGTDVEDDVHRLRAGALSISQATEQGTVYRPSEIGALSGFARERGIPLHMDGTRFHNALVSTGAAPAELTWRNGVDVLCLGATKGGALAAEVVVFFDRALAADFARQVKRTGHLLSKAWMISAQLQAYFADGLWLRNARHANAMAGRLAQSLLDGAGLQTQYPVEANIVFVRLAAAKAAELERRGFQFYRWDQSQDPLARFVTSHRTNESDVDALVECIA